MSKLDWKTLYVVRKQNLATALALVVLWTTYAVLYLTSVLPIGDLFHTDNTSFKHGLNAGVALMFVVASWYNLVMVYLEQRWPCKCEPEEVTEEV